MAQDKETRINGDITGSQVRLVGIDGEPLGIMSLTEAFAKAEEADIDLVEIAPNAEPPVCRLLDYGKFKYAESKKQHEVKLKQKQVSIKEVKFRPGTDDGDYAIKVRNIIRFIQDGDKAKITLRFRGREITHQEFGLALLRRVEADTKDVAVVEQFPKMEGRQMVMVLGPPKKT
ncbi:MAG: translation initiation factor IF-3 [Methylotenera sp.]|nr:translation initiation factor IF-3 [Methylotenera sp.]